MENKKPFYFISSCVIIMFTLYNKQKSHTDSIKFKSNIHNIKTYNHSTYTGTNTYKNSAFASK